MDAIDVLDGAYKARAEYNGIKRKGVIVKLTAESVKGVIRYDVNVIFFPYRDPEDFLISYDAVFTKTVYEGKGRRSKKREAEFIARLKDTVGEMLENEDAEIFWDEEIRPCRRA